MEPTARIFDVQKFSLQDGPGIRTTVFFKGCNLRCAWCHNPEGLENEIQTGVRNGLTYGRDVGLTELLCEVLTDNPFYQASGGGLTCSGGECMLQTDFLQAFLAACKQNGLHTAVDTAGNVPWNDLLRILPVTDLFLYDLKAGSDAVHRAYTGASNLRIRENLSRLAATGAKIWLRIPLIRGINDQEEQLREIAALLRSIQFSQRIDLLAYHTYGRKKYQELNGKEQALFAAPVSKTLTHWGETLGEITPEVYITG